MKTIALTLEMKPTLVPSPNPTEYSLPAFFPQSDYPQLGKINR